MERTNIGEVGRVIPSALVVDVVTMDVSYLAIADAVPQLEAVRLAPDVDLVALVKPMYELHHRALPADKSELERALAQGVHARRSRKAFTQGVHARRSRRRARDRR